MRNQINVIILAFVSLGLKSLAAQPAQTWNQIYEEGDNNTGYAVAYGTDRVYVSGSTSSSGQWNACLICYGDNGKLMWDDVYDGGSDDFGCGITRDADGDVYMTGRTNNGSDYDLLLARFDFAGHLRWRWSFDYGEGESGFDVAVTDNGDIYVSGIVTDGANDDILILKCNSDGKELWHETFGADIYDWGTGADVDAQGNVWVAGYTGNDQTGDFRILRYDPDGNQLCNHTYDSGNEDRGYDVCVDGEYLYVCGNSFNETDSDFRVIKYDSDGNQIWNQIFDSGRNDVALSMAVDDYFVYVTGYTSNGSDCDFCTVRLDKDGNIDWNVDFDDTDCNDFGGGVASDGQGCVYVAGRSARATGQVCRTIKYEQDDYPVSVEETPYVSELSLDIIDNLTSSPTLRFSLPADQAGKLTFYLIDGRMVESSELSSNQSYFTWDASPFPQGVYFVVLESGSQTITEKIVTLK